MKQASSSNSLLEQIKDHIKKHGFISFADFMQQALYTEKLGYYMRDSMLIGKDFITAPHLGSWFAKCIYPTWQKVQQKAPAACIIEFGPGSGKLCFDLLTECAKQNCLPENYFLIEISKSLQQQQQQLIKTLPKELSSKVKWLKECPKANGLILANEFFDAWPVEQFHLKKAKIHQRCIGLDANDNLVWQLKELPCNSPLGEQVAKLSLPEHEDYYSEIQLNLHDWWRNISQQVNYGAILAIDYGMTQEQYYSLGRSKGTLRCHFQHQAHDNPLINVGLQDITSQVDFTAIAKAATKSNWQLGGFCSQSQFMLASGLDKLLLKAEASLSSKDHYHIKQLLMPNQMGDAFKVFGASKNIDLNWFNQHNKIAYLS